MIELARVLVDHEGAVQADLIDRGLRLRWVWDPVDDRVTFADVWIVVQAALLDPASHLMRSMHPELARWGLEPQLLASLVDEVRGLRWQVAAALGAAKERDYPEPIERPGVVRERPVNLLFNNPEGKNLDPGSIVDPRVWLLEEDPRWVRTA